ncbi:hypothetical protein LSH36_227g06072 [Paralvinella palmiformis]|uniref:VWFA domain-containing protein n=1 Tax=Paralvinella palmiformis TaxID=53620 RepID=A0AAD9JMQ2_9ANNE|nr:hypothetical protein LSH36_227g06072 [Paralvinella palmiformis]
MRPVICLYLWLTLRHLASGYHHYESEEVGTLSGDVQNWAILLQNYILQLASEGIKREYTQSLFDTANYTYQEKDGDEIVRQVKESLGDYFSKKKHAAQRIARRAVLLYDAWYLKNSTSQYRQLRHLPDNIYRDSDIPSRLPPDLHFSPYFKQPVSWNYSTVKISDEVPRDDGATIETVYWTAQLEEVFKLSAKEDPFLSSYHQPAPDTAANRTVENRDAVKIEGCDSGSAEMGRKKRVEAHRDGAEAKWQYFGSTAGLSRLYPGREWDTNFAGFYNDYDPRIRPWYIAATSGPKDVVIVLDCSLSMKGEKFSIAQAVAKTVINTLTRQDYVNVVCARASHWDEVGKWHLFSTDVLSCQQDHLVQATIAHRKDLIEKIYNLEPGGTSELEKGIEVAFDLLSGKTRTGCQSTIVFVTDGQDTDGEEVRCGPGYYTRSGYVPGPICKYNWTKVWDMATKKNANTSPQARIFSYLTIDEGELFPGKLACEHRGSMKKLMIGENLITQMSNYFDFLSRNAKNSDGIWTSPYLDAFGLGLMVTYAIPCISEVTGQTIGVAGIDATLDEIENFLSRHQWGTVYSFLMNKYGEAIFHPRLKPSTKLVDDPIFIPIQHLEQDKDRNPPEFSQVIKDMTAGKTGHIRVEKARKGRGGKYLAATFYYAALNDSEYSFAFSLSDTDKVFRRAQEPEDKANYEKSYFNLLIEYNSKIARQKFPGTFEYLQVKYNEKKYPGLRVSYLHSSIFLAPKCHCDPNAYFYDDDLAQKTVAAHRYINSDTPDYGCDQEKRSRYVKSVRADVLITQPIEKLWRIRNFEGIEDVKWTYVGMRSGVFRTYPGHRSTRSYDPSRRPWFMRASSAPSKTSISTAYMDAAGVGKIITISQALFEGMTPRTDDECNNLTKPLPGGCRCDSDADCIIGVCYLSQAPGPNRDSPRCATERVEAVTSLDILYSRFHEIAMSTMQASDGKKSCGQKYDCPDGEPECETRCYLFDNSANLIIDPDFLTADNLDVSKYKGVTMGKKEGEVMKDLIYKHGFFQRKESLDFQGVCSISPYAPKVTLEGIPKNPEELDDYYKNKGPIPKFDNEFGCITDVVKYRANEAALGPSNMITGNVSGPCMSGFYYITQLPKTNLFMLIIENWKQYKDTVFYNFNCKIAQSIVNSGAYRIINGTCAHTDSREATLAEVGQCPVLRDIDIKCNYNRGRTHHSLEHLTALLILVTIATRWFIL